MRNVFQEEIKVRVPINVRRTIDEAAERRTLTLSAWVREAIDEKLKNEPTSKAQ